MTTKMVDYLANDAFQKKCHTIMTELFNSNLTMIENAPPDVFKNLTQKIETLKTECYNFK